MVSDEAPKMAVRTSGSGPDVVLFHGGMGCWRHWIRNIDALAARFTVHALDHPSYGASASVPRETTGAEYLELFDRLFAERFPGDEPLRFAGFSFGGAIAAHLARRLGPRVTHLCLVSPAGFPTRTFGERPTRSYREAGDDDARFREICRHNLLINMLSDPASVTEETIDIQAYCVRNTRFNSRKVSGGGTLLDDLAHLPGRRPRAVGRARRLPVPARRSPDRRDPRRRRRARPAPDSEGRPLVGLRERARGQPADARVLLRALTSPTARAPYGRRGGGSTMDGMPPRHLAPRHLPMTRAELDARGIDAPDVVLVTGDAYVDHPSFAMAILGRWLESLGYSVAILAQPDWKSAEPWRALGRPRLFYGVSAGNMDSMINHYTASRKPRSDDAYSPGGRPGLRPDRPTPVYCQRCREAFPGVPVIAGGVEASLRRLAHYDYWSDMVRPSILVPSKCDLLVHGMGERAIREIADRLAAGEDVKAPARYPGRGLSAGRERDAARRRRRAAELRGRSPRARPTACASSRRPRARSTARPIP